MNRRQKRCILQAKNVKKEDFFMDGNRKHYRVALQELRENPDKGIYLTQTELKKYGIFAGLILAILTFVAVFDRKH